VSHRDGTLLTYCVTPGSGGEARFCSATWSRDGLVIGLFARQLSADNLSLWLQAVLDRLIGDLSDP
jgi:hypothetical protein